MEHRPTASEGGSRLSAWRGRAEPRKSLAKPGQVQAGTAVPFGGCLGKLLAAWP